MVLTHLRRGRGRFGRGRKRSPHPWVGFAFPPPSRSRLSASRAAGPTAPSQLRAGSTGPGVAGPARLRCCAYASSRTRRASRASARTTARGSAVNAGRLHHRLRSRPHVAEELEEALLVGPLVDHEDLAVASRRSGARSRRALTAWSRIPRIFSGFSAAYRLDRAGHHREPCVMITDIGSLLVVVRASLAPLGSPGQARLWRSRINVSSSRTLRSRHAPKKAA